VAEVDYSGIGATQGAGDDDTDLLNKWLRGTNPSAALMRAVTGLGQKDGLSKLDNSGADVPAHATQRGERVQPNTTQYFQSQADLKAGRPSSIVRSFASAADMDRPSFDTNASDGDTTIVPTKTGSAADYGTKPYGTGPGELPPGVDPGSPQALKYLTPVSTSVKREGGGATFAPGDSPLKFAWGGGTPQSVSPTRDAISIAAGRPATQTIYDPSRATDAHVTMDSSGGPGGYVQSQTDWSKVANPMAFSAFRELPQQMMTALLSKDPLAIEKAKADIEAQKAGKIAGATGEAHLAIQERGRRLYEAAVDRMHTLADQQLQAAEKLPEIQRQRKRDEIMRGLESAKVQLQAEYGYQPRPLGMGGMFGGGGGSLDLGAYPGALYPPG